MRMKARQHGFTLVELLVVMVLISLLLTIAAPRYFSSLDKSKETVLRQNLSLTRASLDKYYGDMGKYPDSLEMLVTKKYLRKLPFDPVTESTTTWIIIAPEEIDKGGVFDIKSGAPGNASDGSAYSDW